MVNETHTGLNLNAVIDAIADRVAAKIAGRTEGGPVRPRLLTVDQAALVVTLDRDGID